MVDEVKPYTREELDAFELDYDVERGGPADDFYAWMGRHVEQFDRLLATARGGLADSERLDWLDERGKARLDFFSHMMPGLPGGGYVESTYPDGHESKNYPTLREAIDASRAGRETNAGASAGAPRSDAADAILDSLPALVREDERDVRYGSAPTFHNEYIITARQIELLRAELRSAQRDAPQSVRSASRAGRTPAPTGESKGTWGECRPCGTRFDSEDALANHRCPARFVGEGSPTPAPTDAERYVELRRLLFEEMPVVETLRCLAPRDFDREIDAWVKSGRTAEPQGEAPKAVNGSAPAKEGA